MAWRSQTSTKCLLPVPFGVGVWWRPKAASTGPTGREDRLCSYLQNWAGSGGKTAWVGIVFITGSKGLGWYIASTGLTVLLTIFSNTMQCLTDSTMLFVVSSRVSIFFLCPSLQFWSLSSKSYRIKKKTIIVSSHFTILYTCTKHKTANLSSWTLFFQGWSTCIFKVTYIFPKDCIKSNSTELF